MDENQHKIERATDKRTLDIPLVKNQNTHSVATTADSDCFFLPWTFTYIYSPPSKTKQNRHALGYLVVDWGTVRTHEIQLYDVRRPDTTSITGQGRTASHVKTVFRGKEEETRMEG